MRCGRGLRNGYAPEVRLRGIAGYEVAAWYSGCLAEDFFFS